jgi:hypothetical protein
MQPSKWIIFIYACAGFVMFVVGIVTKLIALWAVGIALMLLAVIRESNLRRSGAAEDRSEDPS